jgi:hypothetical protein
MKNKFIIGLLGLVILSTQLWAQDVEVEKNTGLVKIDGVDVFYLTPKNKKIFVCDYSLENLQHKELAYLKYSQYGNDNFYYMVFTQSGNQCTLKYNSILGNIKQIAKMIAGASLVQNDAISETEERKFIILHHGNFIKDPNQAPPVVEKVIVNNDNQRKTPIVADIIIKEDKIYNNSELVGVFKSKVEEGKTIISVYNANDAMICKASRVEADKNADWSLLLDEKSVTLLYNPTTPLEKLFKYLVEKGYL